MSRKITIRLLAVVCLGILLVMMTRVSFAMFLENGLDSTPHVVNGEQAPSPQDHDQSGTNDWVGHELIKGAISAAATALGAAIGAVAAGIFAYRKWLTEHLSGKWYEMIDLASTNPKFMNAEKNGSVAPSKDVERGFAPTRTNIDRGVPCPLPSAFGGLLAKRLRWGRESSIALRKLVQCRMSCPLCLCSLNDLQLSSCAQDGCHRMMSSRPP
jgi:hypothetical protein